jgi:PAS domain S-box-containing protein
VVGVYGIAKDITDSKRALRERETAVADLARRERDYATLVDNAPDVLARFDRHFRILYVNEQGTRALGGLPRAAILGRTLREIGDGRLPDAAIDGWERALGRVFANSDTVAFTFALPSRHGRDNWFETILTPEFGADGGMEHVVTVTRNVTDRHNAEIERDARLRIERAAAEEARAAATRRRRLLCEMLSSLTEGHLMLCDSDADLPKPLESAAPPIDVSAPTLRTLRKQVEQVAAMHGTGREREHDLICAVGEAAMNAVRHAGGGVARVHADPESGVVQVWVTDSGQGISEESLHRAVLEKGFSSAGTFGHGFWMMLHMCDRVYLLTGPTGTTVVLEQSRIAPAPLWLFAR